MEYQDGLFIGACVTAIVVHLAPMIAFRWVKSIVHYAPYSYLFTVLSSLLWVVYGLDWGLVALWRLSLLGTVLGAAYVVLFLWYSDQPDPRLDYLLRWTYGGTGLVVVAIALELIFPRNTLYRVICCLASCFASVAPFYKLPRVLEEKSMRTMPCIIIPAIGLTNAVLWTIRNTTVVAPKDIDCIVVVASGFAALCALGQLVLHAVFCRQQPPPPPTGLGAPLINKEEGSSPRIGLGDPSRDGEDPDSEDSDGYVSSGNNGQLKFEHWMKVASSSDEEVDKDATEVAQDRRVGEDPRSEENDVTLGSGGNGQLGDGKVEHQVQVEPSSDEKVAKEATEVTQHRRGGKNPDSEDHDVSSGSGGNGQLSDGEAKRRVQVTPSSDEEAAKDAAKVAKPPPTAEHQPEIVEADDAP